MIHYHLGFSVVRRNSINIYLSLSISDFHQMVSSRYNCQLTVIQSLHTFYQIMVLRIKHHCLPRSYSAIAYLPDSSLHCAIYFTPAPLVLFAVLEPSRMFGIEFASAAHSIKKFSLHSWLNSSVSQWRPPYLLIPCLTSLNGTYFYLKNSCFFAYYLLTAAQM